MKSLIKLFWILALVPALVFLNGCNDDGDDNPDPDPVAQDRFEVVKNYVIANGMDLPNILDSWITTSENVYTVMTDDDATNDYYIIDIRTSTDFGNGHIQWAHNSTLVNILEEAKNAEGKKVLVVCYTGQTAGHGVVALRLSGYPDAQVLKWGMASWNPTTAGAWLNSTGDAASGSANWTAAPGAIATNKVGTAPKLEFLTDDPAEILADRVGELLANGFKGVNATDALAAPDNYFINNFWAATDVEHYGNIKGAYRINPLSIAGGEYAYLDAGSKVLTYCWTGQTSSMITAYLNILGFDAYSLKFGSNSMLYSTLESHKFSDTEIKDYPLAQ